MNKCQLLSVAAVCALALLSAAGAQTPTAPVILAHPEIDAPGPNPTGLPGDSPLPSIEFQLHATAGPHPGIGTQPETHNATPGPPVALALEAARAALDACTAKGFRIGVAVTDSAGQLRVGIAADGGSPGRIFTAVRKDLAAIAFKMPTSAARAMILANPTLLATLKPNMSIFPGAVPIMVGERVLGAIAASGATGDQEEQCATLGLKRIQGRLR
jgi:uncharacterized protein GlcG (DUF336 family)